MENTWWKLGCLPGNLGNTWQKPGVRRVAELKNLYTSYCSGRSGAAGGISAPGKNLAFTRWKAGCQGHSKCLSTQRTPGFYQVFVGWTGILERPWQPAFHPAYTWATPGAKWFFDLATWFPPGKRQVFAGWLLGGQGARTW